MTKLQARIDAPHPMGGRIPGALHDASADDVRATVGTAPPSHHAFTKDWSVHMWYVGDARLMVFAGDVPANVINRY